MQLQSVAQAPLQHGAYQQKQQFQAWIGHIDPTTRIEDASRKQRFFPRQAVATEVLMSKRQPIMKMQMNEMSCGMVEPEIILNTGMTPRRPRQKAPEAAFCQNTL
ncbi:hypothetical protein [Microvirga sp. G4-2]|uniref:hypothetical protein n=1 Tax=Microvirga sp. G4-2 TaxID=3434467 RepID=UPI004043F538